MVAPLVVLRNLTVDFRSGEHVSRAVDIAEFEIGAGEAVGVVGESGSGKSVTWLAALGLLPTRASVGGSVRIDGQELVGAPAPTLERIRGKRIAMIFQDPSSCLNPVHRIGWQLSEALGLHRGLDGPAAQAEALRVQNAALTQSKEVLELRRIEVEKIKAERWDGKLPQNIYAGAPIPFLQVGK